VASPAAVRALAGLNQLDQRVATVGHRLAVAGTELCVERHWLPGFSLHHLSQYSGDLRTAAASLFPLEDAPQVLTVAQGGPAQRAGLQPGDTLLEVDGLPVTAAGDLDLAPEALIESIWRRISVALTDGSAQLMIMRGQGRLTLDVVAVEGCASRFELLPSSKLNARANGSHVLVTTGIMALVQNDDELAAVLAHELAHNVLQHQSAANRKRSEREREIEADRLSLYLMDRAGFDPQASVAFWERFRPRRGLFSRSHPHWRKRVEILQQEIANLERQRASVIRPMPQSNP
jgi:predicted Zn-dependent protease